MLKDFKDTKFLKTDSRIGKLLDQHTNQVRDNSLHSFEAKWLSFIHNKELYKSLECPRSLWNDDGINDDVMLRK